ncbi:serine proteinase [Trichophyton tonsurans CBS 112818]|uniref:Subtilisin-like protease 1 n=2 Tax=Trichophyton tonsurans TaxID=34387 RepID=SUB1_TRITO|nr:RecName: Full=Subtilisin-like protease 1; Flags: Precursor [Trichophyton tonsurans]ACL37326.1 subtilisin-like protease 1 [Trichophyton tonsurans]EGD93553.1 serine proteinase [Trichophyton tonsurans CBS 112818]
MGVFRFISISLAAVSAANAAQILSMPHAQTVPHSYIVMMKDDTSDDDFNHHQSWLQSTHTHNITRRATIQNAGMRHKYNFRKMKGYSGIFDEETIKDIAKDPKVMFVEPDTIISVNGKVEQSNVPSWGLARISNSQPGANSYVYDSSAGEGITVYSVDTGVDINHEDFEGRAIWGSNQVNDGDDRDGSGHGTHTSGTMVGKEFGIAKKAKLVAVKVLGNDGSGPTSGIVAGINWCVEHARQNGGTDKAVMNMSLGGSSSSALNRAAAQAVEQGMFLSVAAGNENQDARSSSPASEPSVCTVGSSAEDDSRSSFSNWGPALDLFAPGSNIISARPGGGSQSMSGTSMAAPHVAGLAAYLMALEGISGGAVCDRLKELGSSSITDVGPGTPTNVLISNGGAKGGNPKPAPGPSPNPSQPSEPQQPAPSQPGEPGESFPGEPFPGEPFPGEPFPGESSPGESAPAPAPMPPSPQHPHTPYPGGDNFDFDGYWKKYFGGEHWRKMFGSFWN